MSNTLHLDTVEACVDHIIDQLGHDIRVGLPLGLGKPSELTNALYQRARQNSDIKLTIATALTLEVPDPGSGLQKRFMEPFLERVFDGYAGFDYMRDLRAGTLPDNISVHEFFFKSGAMLNIDQAQQNYICTNYTHAVRDILNMNINLVAQMLACREQDGQYQYSMSCNPEISRDLMPVIKSRKKNGERILVVGQINEQLPFMVHDAIIEEQDLDVVIRNPEYNSTLFAPPNMPVSTADYMIGLHTSTLIADGGTLQLGIGSLCDAVAYACELRHQHNDTYQALLRELDSHSRYDELLRILGGDTPFETGLFGSSEMFVGAFHHLMELGILKRCVYDHEGLQRLINSGEISEPVQPPHLETLLRHGLIQDPLTETDIAFLIHYGFLKPIAGSNHGPLTLNSITESDMGRHLQHGCFMHGGFFLGSRAFYDSLRNLDEQTRNGINMTNISFVNALYGDEQLKRAQRVKARFINTVFLAHVLGGATSDGLDNGKVVSGVGGQYNFVAQAHELDDGRSILMLKSTRKKDGVLQSNIVWNYAHTTIPRHLRDIYVTEYGIADVRGKCDRDVAAAMINIADSRFQENLVAKAIANGKLPVGYRVPDAFRNNLPGVLENRLKSYREQGYFPAFPCGSDFTDVELEVARCLKAMQAKSAHKSNLIKAFFKSLFNQDVPAHTHPYLERMQLLNPTNRADKIARTLMLDELPKA